VRIELIPDGSPDCPLIRLFDYRDNELELLQIACRELANGQRAEFALHEQTWVEPQDGLRFTWKASAQDVGVELPALGDPFVLEFSDEAWREVDDKISRLMPAQTGFNWLTNEGEVKVLLSRDGKW